MTRANPSANPPSNRPADWLVPDWPAPPAVRAVCTTRACPAGVAPSAMPWGDFNLARHVGDAPQAVAAHRVALAACLGARPVFLEQTHGTRAICLRPETPDGLPADAAVTGAAGLACAVMVADCLPVLLARADGRAVAAAHAGWRGLAGGVLEAAAQALRHMDAPDAAACPEVIAWLGPCIGPAAFEVGPEVRATFIEAAHAPAETAACFAPLPGGKYLADLPALARLRLAALRIRAWGNDGTPAWCTASQPQRFYSWRAASRARQSRRRMAACIWLENAAG